jgi:GTP-binding protein EngB required for normal cell division
MSFEEKLAAITGMTEEKINIKDVIRMMETGTIEQIKEYISQQPACFKSVLDIMLHEVKENKFRELKNDIEKNKIIFKDFKRILVIGKIGAGKSTLINLLFNGGVDAESLRFPATTSDMINGVTLKTTNYYSFLKSYILTDTIGYGDERFSEVEILQDIKMLTRSLNTGFNIIIVVIKYGRQSNEDRFIIDMLARLLGRDWQDNSVLAVTYSGSKKLEHFIDTIKDDSEYIKFCSKFKSVVMVENGIDDDPIIEGRRFGKRSDTLCEFTKIIDNANGFIVPKPDNIFMAMYDIWIMIKRYLKTATKMIKLNRSNQFENLAGVCPICTFNIIVDECYIPKNCKHIIHRVCVGEDERKLVICPTCKLEF